MTWEDILKISTEEAISDARRFVPEDVEQGEKDIAEREKKRIQLNIEKTLPKRRRTLKIFINLMKDNPTFAKSDMGKVIEFHIKAAHSELMNPEEFDRHITSMKLILKNYDGPQIFRDGTYTKEGDEE